MASVHWSLEVRGRLRPKAFLVDADGRELARVRRDGKVRAVRAGGATDPEGREWRVVGPPENLRVSCAGESRATVLDGVLEAGDRTYGWRVAEDGTRTARVTSATGGGTVLRIDPGDGDAWARIAFDDGLPEPFGVVLAAAIRLLEAEDPFWGPGGPGAGGRKSRIDAAVQEARAPRPAGAADDGGGAAGRRPAGAADDGGGAAGPTTDDGGAAGPAGEDAVPAAAASAGAAAGSTGGAVATGEADGSADPLDVQWAVHVEGRARPRILLTDGGADPVATLSVRGGPTGSLGVATDRDGRRWVAELDGGVVTMRCAGRAMARAEGEELTVGGRTLAWRASLDGARTATATGDDGRELLRLRPGPDGDGAWVAIELDDRLPSPLAATLATLFVLLRVDALGRRG